MKIGIIGAGIAGLAAAVRMAARGHAVEVFEANDYPGGKLSAFDQEGYRFDAGPSLFTMPQYVDELFRLAGEDPSDYFRYQRMPETCRYFWSDGTRLQAWAAPEQFAEAAEQALGVPAAKTLAFLQKSERKYALAGYIFLEKSLHRIKTWLSRDVLRALFRLPTFDIFSSMHSVHERWFQNPKMSQLFNRYATYNGSDPYQASGMLTIIPHFEHNIGVYYPEGGMHSITTALYELALRKGVRFHFNRRVSAIWVEDNRLLGLELGEERHAFDRVISNMDVYYTYRRLLPGLTAPERILSQPKSSSALIFYWGIERTFDTLGLHNIFFSDDYRREFSCLQAGEMTDDPTIYVNITSKYTESDAPPGCENWFVMINAPADQGQDWAAVVPDLRARTIAKLNRLLGADLNACIVNESVMTPHDIDIKTASHAGALYGYSSNTLMAAFLRHPNFSKQIKGLHFVGGSIHPGGGIPLCLLSAKITDEIIHG